MWEMKLCLVLKIELVVFVFNTNNMEEEVIHILTYSLDAYIETRSLFRFGFSAKSAMPQQITNSIFGFQNK